MQVNSHLI
jgi:hypothetical protein